MTSEDKDENDLPHDEVSGPDVSTADEAQTTTADAASVSNSNNEIDSFLAAMRDEERKAEEAYTANVRRSEYESNLKEALSILQKDDHFEPGDLVQWKKFMKASDYPHMGAPAVVVRYLDEPMTTGREGVTFAEPRDIVIGYLNGENDFVVNFYSSARFTSWE